MISPCLKHVANIAGLALGVLNSFRFDFFTFGNCYGFLITYFVFISSFICRSNWPTKVDLSNKKTAFHKLPMFLYRSCFSTASCSRFLALLALSPFASWSNLAPQFFLAKLQCEHLIHVVLTPVRCCLPQNKCLALTRSLLSTSFDSVSPRLFILSIFLSTLYSVNLQILLC